MGHILRIIFLLWGFLWAQNWNLSKRLLKRILILPLRGSVYTQNTILFHKKQMIHFIFHHNPSQFWGKKFCFLDAFALVFPRQFLAGPYISFHISSIMSRDTPF